MSDESQTPDPRVRPDDFPTEFVHAYTICEKPREAPREVDYGAVSRNLKKPYAEGAAAVRAAAVTKAEAAMGLAEVNATIANVDVAIGEMDRKTQPVRDDLDGTNAVEEVFSGDHHPLKKYDAGLGVVCLGAIGGLVAAAAVTANRTFEASGYATSIHMGLVMSVPLVSGGLVPKALHLCSRNDAEYRTFKKRLAVMVGVMSIPYVVIFAGAFGDAAASVGGGGVVIALGQAAAEPVVNWTAWWRKIFIAFSILYENSAAGLAGVVFADLCWHRRKHTHHKPTKFKNLEDRVNRADTIRGDGRNVRVDLIGIREGIRSRADDFGQRSVDVYDEALKVIADKQAAAADFRPVASSLPLF